MIISYKITLNIFVKSGSYHHCDFGMKFDNKKPLTLLFLWEDIRRGCEIMQRILIVDDEKAILLAFRKLLRSPGIAVDTAETIEEAEDLLKENTYNVAIVDLRLTGVDGEEGLKIIKHIKEYYSQTEVILVTGYGNSIVMEKAQAKGAAFYFEKPVSSEVLKDALKSLNVG